MITWPETANSSFHYGGTIKVCHSIFETYHYTTGSTRGTPKSFLQRNGDDTDTRSQQQNVKQSTVSRGQ